MRSTRRLAPAALALLLALAACGSDATEPEAKGGGAQMTARIDGKAWASTIAFATSGQPGHAIAVSGSDQALQTIAFSFINAGTGTYEITPGMPTNALLSEGSVQWQAGASSQGTGTITVTTLNAERIAGTFEFTAEPVSGGATGTRVVAQGKFDVEF